MPPASVMQGKSLPAALKAPIAPRAPSSLLPRTAVTSGLPCRALPTSACTCARSLATMLVTISAHQAAVATSAFLGGGLELFLAGGPGGVLLEDHLRLAVELLVDAIAKGFLTDRLTLLVVLDVLKGQGRLHAAEAVVLMDRVQQHHHALVLGCLHYGRRVIAARPR